MDPAALETLVTAGGAGVATTLISEVIFRTLGSGVDKSRFGAIVAVGIGVVVVVTATLALGLGTSQDIAQAVFTGLFAGASAIGIHDIVTGVTKPATP